MEAVERPPNSGPAPPVVHDEPRARGGPGSGDEARQVEPPGLERGGDLVAEAMPPERQARGLPPAAREPVQAGESAARLEGRGEPRGTRIAGCDAGEVEPRRPGQRFVDL